MAVHVHGRFCMPGARTPASGGLPAGRARTDLRLVRTGSAWGEDRSIGRSTPARARLNEARRRRRFSDFRFASRLVHHQLAEESCVLLSDPRAPQWHEWIARARAAAGGGRPQRGSVCLHAGTLKTFHLYDAQRRFITAIHLCQTVFIIVYGFFNKPSPMAKFMPRSSFKKNSHLRLAGLVNF